VMAEARQALGIPLHVLIRPREGAFCYAGDEIEAMLRDIATAARLGADGVAIGALDAASRVDRELTGALLGAARPLAVTFHRAFDAVRDPLEAAEVLLTLGIERVLTSGGAATAEAGIPVLAELVRRGTPRLTVLAGGGIRAHNAGRIVRQTGVGELHLRAGPGAAWVREVVAALTPGSAA